MRLDDPRHGTYAGYQAHQKERSPVCDLCLAARRSYNRRAAYDQALGRSRTVDPATAQAHIVECVAWGMRLTPFVRAGVPSIAAIHAGQVKRIHASTEARILNVIPEPGVNCWPAFSAIRRLRALVALGHSQEDLTERLGSYRSYVSMLINDTRGWRHLDPAMWQRIADLYEELAMRPGPSPRARNRGIARGWAPPLAWDDINDPGERPAMGRDRHRSRSDIDEVVVLRILAGERMPCTKAEKEEVTRRWIRLGRSLAELEERTGWRSGRYGHVNEQVAS